MWNIFEHWWTALLVAAIVQMTLTIIHIVKPSSRKLWHVLIPLAIIVVGIGVERLVQTDMEKINALIGKCLKVTADEDLPGIESLLAPDYSDSVHATKEVAMEYCRHLFSRPLIAENKEYPGTEIIISRPTAQVNLVVVTHIDRKSEYAEMAQVPLVVKVKLQLERNAEGKWLIKSAELLTINSQPARWNQF